MLSRTGNRMNTCRNLTPAFALLAASLAMGAAPPGNPTAAHDAEIATFIGPVTTPESAPDPDGFIQRWLVLEPINVGNQQPQDATRETIKKEYFPNQLTVVPRDGDKVKVNDQELTWHAVDAKKYNVSLYHVASQWKKSSANALFWTVTVVNAPKEMRNVRLAVGSNASSVWWVNGEEVAGVYGDIQTVVDDGVSKRLTLKKGPNIIRGAIINGSGGSDFVARFLDENGNPIKGFTVSTGVAAK
jgi:hypothetical protein